MDGMEPSPSWAWACPLPPSPTPLGKENHKEQLQWGLHERRVSKIPWLVLLHGSLVPAVFCLEVV